MTLAGTTSVCAQPFIEVVADFEGLTEGSIVNQISSGQGVSGPTVSGFIGVFAQSDAASAAPGNTATVYDATCNGAPENCSGGDDDLFNPPLGNILIMDEYGDADGDGFVDGPDGPDDANNGGEFEFDFSSFGQGTVRLESITVQDIDADRAPSYLRVFRGDLLLDEIVLERTGDDDAEVVPIGIDGADVTRIQASQSSGIDNLVLNVCEPQVDASNAFASGASFPLDGQISALGLVDLAVSVSGAVSSSQSGEGRDNQSSTGLVVEVPGVVTATLNRNASRSDIDADRATNLSRHELVDIQLLDGMITADSITVQARASATELGSSADTFGSRVEGLRVNGEFVDISRYNQRVLIPGVGVLHVMERILDKSVDGPNNAAAEVNALRLAIDTSVDGSGAGAGDLVIGEVDLSADLIAMLQSTLLAADITIGHADAQAEFPRNNCIAPLDFEVSASAKVAGIDVRNIASTDFVTAGPIPASGGHDFAAALQINVPTLIDSGTATADAQGGFDGLRASARALARVQDLNVLDGLIVAELVEAQSRTETDQNGTGSEGDTTLIDMVIDGNDVCAAIGQPAQDNICTPAPNTVVPLNVPGVLQIVLNEQTPTGELPSGAVCGAGDNSCTVNAVRITLLDGLGEIVIANAYSDPVIKAPASQFGTQNTGGGDSGGTPIGGGSGGGAVSGGGANLAGGGSSGGGGGGCALQRGATAPVDPLFALMLLSAGLLWRRRQHRVMRPMD